jgi:hypothetical protein
VSKVFMAFNLRVNPYFKRDATGNVSASDRLMTHQAPPFKSACGLQCHQ